MRRQKREFAWRRGLAGVVVALAVSGLASMADTERAFSGQRRVSLSIAGGGPGSGVYVEAGAIAQYIRTRSGLEWLSITPQTTGGVVENVRLLGRREVELGIVATSDVYAALRGLAPFSGEQSYSHLFAVFPITVSATQWVTYNPRLRTLADLAGRRVNLGPPGSASAQYGQYTLEAAGVWERVQKEFVNWSQGVRLMQDGIVDAVTVTGPPPFPAVQEAAAVYGKRLYFVELGAAAIEGVIRRNPSLQPQVVQPDVYGPGIPAEPYRSVGYLAVLAATDAAPSDAVYEMLKALLTPDGRRYLINSISVFEAGFATLPAGFFASLEAVGMRLHPGAVRYYREAGYEIPASLLPERP